MDDEVQQRVDTVHGGYLIELVSRKEFGRPTIEGLSFGSA